MVEPQACISSATMMSSARGSAMASWVRYSCLHGCHGRSSPRRSNLGSSASLATASTTGPNLSPIFCSSTGRLVRRALLQHVVQDAGDDGHLLAPVAGQDDGDVGRVRQVVHARRRPGPRRRGTWRRRRTRG